MADDDADGAFQRLRSSVMLDTRSSQNLELVRLPGKLRDRIEKAQRRAHAAKDGVSIFASSTEHLDPSSSLLSPQRAAVTSSVSATAGRSQTAPTGTNNSSLTGTSPLSHDGVLTLAKDKIRLPEVVLSHKMRDFEAKTYTNSLLADPLDSTLNKLTVEEKERVMARMQEKIQLLTSEIDDNFVKIKRDLDANGIFGSAANYQRAQALCLVELQKRCKLELLRDEAIEEVVGGQLSRLVSKKSDAKRSTRMSGKLSMLLTHSSQVDHGGGERPGSKSSFQTRNQPHHRTKKKRATPNRQLVKRLLTLSGATNPRQGNDSNQAKAETDEHNKTQDRYGSSSSSSSRQPQRSKSPSGRRETHRGVSRDDPSGMGGGDRGGSDAMTARHPHIAQVLQQLASLRDSANVEPSNGGRISNSSHARFAATSGNASTMALNDIDESRPKSAEDQWRERSNSYRMITSRVTEALRNRSERRRWDAMGHFGSCLGDAPISESLTRKVASQHHRRFTTIPSGNGDKHANDDDDNNKSMSTSCDDDTCSHQNTLELRKRMQQEYARIQEQIRARLLRERGKKTSSAKASQGAKALNQAAAMKSIVHRGSQGASDLLGRQAQCAATPSVATIQENSLSINRSSNAIASAVLTPSTIEQVHDSSTALNGELANESALLPPPRSPSLCASSSAPEFQTFKSPGLRQSLGRNALELMHRRDGARNSLLQRNAMSVRQNTASRSRRFRKESLIGAPVVTDFSTIGHHSHARMEERRNAAQTWAWYHPSSLTHADQQFASGEHGPETHNVDEEDDKDEYDDAFQDAIDEEDDDEMDDATSRTRDDHEDDLDADDTASSVSFSTSFAPDSARSARSVTTLVHAATATAARRKKLKRRQPGRLHHHQSGSSNNLFHSIGHASASSMALQLRLEEIWRALEFPFSTKLLMLEKYADLQDPDTFQTALTMWEKAAEAVLVRERMKSALSAFAEHESDGNALASCRFTDPEWMYVRSLQIDTPADHVLLTMPLETFIEWIRTHMDAITSKCQRFAHELKATTGDDLLFQGCTYPPRMY
ncbi:hypothetical protein FI667_g13234, partial [Globisporangium splendens]